MRRQFGFHGIGAISMTCGLLALASLAMGWTDFDDAPAPAPLAAPQSLAAPAAPSSSAAVAALEVVTDKASYGIFDQVLITVHDDPGFSISGYIQLDMNVVVYLSFTQTGSGIYTSSWDVPYDAEVGVYTVTVSNVASEAPPDPSPQGLADEATTTFEVVRTSVYYPCATPAYETEYADFAQGTRTGIQILSPDPDGYDDGALMLGGGGPVAAPPDSRKPAVLASGEYLSKEYTFYAYKTVSMPVVVADVPPTATLTMEARTRYDDATEWTEWLPFQDPADTIPPGQYFQFRIQMDPDPLSRSPVVHSVWFCLDTFYPTETPTPTPTDEPTPTPTATVWPSPTFTPPPTQPVPPTATPTVTPSETPTSTPTPSPSPSLTLTPTDTPTPSPSPTGVQGKITFDFVSQLEPAWVYKYAPPLTIPTSSTLSEPPGFLRIQATDNQANFGYWESPEVVLSRQAEYPESVSKDALVLQVPETGPPALLVKYRVFSDQTDPRTCPQLRMRTTGGDFQQSDLLVANSSFGGDFSPTPAGRDYSLLFFPNPEQEQFRFQFDMLNFDPSDADHGILDLDLVEISVVDPLDQPQLIREVLLTFAGGPGCWEQKTAPGIFDEPEFGFDPSDGGAITLSPGGSAQAYGYWCSRCPVTCLDPERTYFVRFQVRSSLSGEGRDQVPSFRVRVNESDFQGCAYTHYTSKVPSDRMPTVEGPTQYYVSFQPDESMASRGLILSFDLLSFDPTDDLNAVLYLEEVEVFSAPQRY